MPDVNLSDRGLIILTTACPVECGHCQYRCNSSKDMHKWMPETTVRKVAEAGSKNSIRRLTISGGEPFYDIPKLFSAIDLICGYYPPETITLATSGFWAINEQVTDNILGNLHSKGITQLAVSTDTFHLKRVPLRNIEHILKYARKNGINLTLRPLFRKDDTHFIKQLSEIVNRYQPNILFSVTDPIGRAELFGKGDLGWNQSYDTFCFMIQNQIRITQKHKDKETFEKDIQLSKPSSPNNLTFFPNGDVYACCVAAKLTYIGNITRCGLNELVAKLENSILGYAWGKTGGCTHLKQLLPPACADACSICKEHPLLESSEVGVDYAGKIFLQIRSNELYSSRVADLCDGNHELLISIVVAPTELNVTTGGRIEEFLDGLTSKGIKFTISRPLPRCLFNVGDYSRILNKFDIPKNCFECHELFIFRDGIFRLCPWVYDFEGLQPQYVTNRAQLCELLDLKKSNAEPIAKCVGCLHFLRSSCDCLEFRRTGKKMGWVCD